MAKLKFALCSFILFISFLLSMFIDNVKEYQQCSAYLVSNATTVAVGVVNTETSVLPFVPVITTGVIAFFVVFKWVVYGIDPYQVAKVVIVELLFVIYSTVSLLEVRPQPCLSQCSIFLHWPDGGMYVNWTSQLLLFLSVIHSKKISWGTNSIIFILLIASLVCSVLVSSTFSVVNTVVVVVFVVTHPIVKRIADYLLIIECPYFERLHSKNVITSL